MANNLEAQRQTAAYARTIAWLRHTQPGLSDEEMDRQGLAAVDAGVYGADAKKDRNGRFIEQGIGSESNPSWNSLAAIRKFEGEESFRRACALHWKRNPEWAAAHNLPKPIA